MLFERYRVQMSAASVPLPYTPIFVCDGPMRTGREQHSQELCLRQSYLNIRRGSVRLDKPTFAETPSSGERLVREIKLAAERFSRRCATDEASGINRILAGEATMTTANRAAKAGATACQVACVCG
jgi:hypothetical protein